MAGPARRSPERNWLETSPGSSTRPPRAAPGRGPGGGPGPPLPPRSPRGPRAPRGAARTGGLAAGAPRRRGPGAPPSAARGSTKRPVVPDWRASNAAAASPRRPEPVTTIVAAASSVDTSAPSPTSAPTIAQVSSANNAPLSRLVPRASAAQTRARLVRLFEPGTTTSARGGRASGSTASTSGTAGTLPPRRPGAALRLVQRSLEPRPQQFADRPGARPGDPPGRARRGCLAR